MDPSAWLWGVTMVALGFAGAGLLAHMVWLRPAMSAAGVPGMRLAWMGGSRVVAALGTVAWVAIAGLAGVVVAIALRGWAGPAEAVIVGLWTVALAGGWRMHARLGEAAAGVDGPTLRLVRTARGNWRFAMVCFGVAALAVVASVLA